MALDTTDPLTAPMPAPPVRQFSFTDFQTNNPTAPPPGDRLDAEFDRVNTSITQTLEWASVSINSDGTLKEQNVGQNGQNAQSDIDYSVALAQDYAEVTMAWAEHMPDTIPPNILAVMGVTGDHWSSRWWANQAAQSFGMLVTLYCGAFPNPPATTITGNPLVPGAIYYNTATQQPYVWNGSAWVQFYAPVKATQLMLIYRATANQTVFPLGTADLNGQSYTLNTTNPEPLDVYVNGVRVPRDAPVDGTGDWDFTPPNTVTFLTPLPAGSIVQIDVLTLPGSGTIVGDAPVDGNVYGRMNAGWTPVVPTSWALNVKSFGAKIDGTTADGPAMGAALAALKPWQALRVPGGAMSIAWLADVQGTTPATPVLFDVDGTLAGGQAMQQAFSRVAKGDVFETFNAGRKLLSKKDAEVDSNGVLEINHNFNASGGSPGWISTPIRVNASDNAAAVDSIWGVHVALTTNSNQPTWPQNVGVSSTVIKNGSAWTAGMHITASDRQNKPTSTGGTMLGMEIGYHGNAADDTLNGTAFGGTGTRMGLHLSLSAENASGALPFVSSFGVLVDGNSDTTVKSVYANGTNTHAYQVFDARGANAPSGYTDPVAAVRMAAGQIVDFSGGAALNSNAGNYLQYTTSGGNRLRYMIGATERMNIPDTKPTVTGSRGGNAALASLLTQLASLGVIIDGTTA